MSITDFSIRLTPLKQIPTTLKPHHSGNSSDDNIDVVGNTSNDDINYVGNNDDDYIDVVGYSSCDDIDVVGKFNTSDDVNGECTFYVKFNY